MKRLTRYITGKNIKPDLNFEKCIDLSIPVIIKKVPSGYVAECVDLNVVTQGNTLTETRKNMKEAILLHLESALELNILGDELKKLRIVKKNKEFEIAPTTLDHLPIEIPC